MVETEVGAVEADSKLLDEPDMGVYGEARGCGELSFIHADFGGTSGGVSQLASPERERIREVDDCRVSLCCEPVDCGMTSGVRDLGERGCCFGEADRDLLREEYEVGAGSGW